MKELRDLKAIGNSFAAIGDGMSVRTAKKNISSQSSRSDILGLRFS
jgi:hypothetical protein